MAGVKEDIREVRGDIKTILTKLSVHQTVRSGSPLQLTELGTQISQEIDAGSIARRLSFDLESRVEGLPAYDIQEFCVDFVNYVWKPDPDDDRAIKDAAYHHGLMKKQVLDVVAVELRDILLALPKKKTVEL